MLTCPGWTSVKDNLRSISFTNKEATLARLPIILERASNLAFVFIKAASVGTAGQPFILQGGITTASRFYLDGNYVYVEIPSSVTWRIIYFIECNELNIRHVKSGLRSLEMCMCWHADSDYRVARPPARA